MSEGARAFTYRVIVPPMWALTGVAAVELVVTHLVLAHWTRWGAVALSVLSFAVLSWVVIGIWSMPRLPVLVRNDLLIMRAGLLRVAEVSTSQVIGTRQDPPAVEVKRRNVLNCALLSHPNVLVSLRTPLPGRCGIIAIAHRLDDPAGFATALEAVLVNG